MNQTLTQRIKKIEKKIERDNKYFTRLFEELTECIQLIQTQVDNQPYTAMRSTGDIKEECTHVIGDCPWCGSKQGKRNPKCGFCFDDKPIKPQEHVREKIYEELVPYMTQGAAFRLSNRILAIVKGE